MYVEPVENQIRRYFWGGIIMLLMVLICGWAIDAYGQCVQKPDGSWDCNKPQNQLNVGGWSADWECKDGLCFPPGSNQRNATALKDWRTVRTQFPVDTKRPSRTPRNRLPAKISQKVRLATCKIIAERPGVREGQQTIERNIGSGILILRGVKHGLVLTVGHLFREKPQRVVVEFLNGEKFEATRIQTNMNGPDLGVVQIPRPNTEPVDVDLTGFAAVGDPIVLCGYPKGGEFRAFGGILRQYMQTNRTDGTFTDYNQMEVDSDAPGGLSGGPMINAEGEVTGIIWGDGAGDNSGNAYGTYSVRLCQFLTSDIQLPWTERIAPWNAKTQQAKIQSAAIVKAAEVAANASVASAQVRASQPAQRLPMIQAAPPVTQAGMDMVARQMAQDALNQVGSLSARVDAAHDEATGALVATKDVAEKADGVAAGLTALEGGMFGKIRTHVIGLVKSWIPGGLLGGGIIGIGLFFLIRKFVAMQLAALIDKITDKTPWGWDDKFIDPLVWKAASVVSGKPVPKYANDPGMDPYGRPIPDYQPQAAAVVTPPPPTAKEAELQAQIDVLKAKGQP